MDFKKKVSGIADKIKNFRLNILLTILGGLPGIIHALWRVATDK